MEPALDSVLLSIPDGNYRRTGFHINIIPYQTEAILKLTAY
jgi:hypothetical protein